MHEIVRTCRSQDCDVILGNEVSVRSAESMIENSIAERLRPAESFSIMLAYKVDSDRGLQ